MRLIDANALEQIITEKFKEHYGNTVYQFMRDFFAFVIRQIRKAPTIEAEPVRHGRWVDKRLIINGGCIDRWECSVCGYEKIGGTNYCPNCGAKMESFTTVSKSETVGEREGEGNG